MTLTFNLLLKDAGIELDTTRLLRHQDNRFKSGWTTYKLWRQRPHEFSRYESVQGRDLFVVGGHVASFVVDPIGDVVFVGLSRVASAGPNLEEEAFETIGEVNPPGSCIAYVLEKAPEFEDLAGRLVIDWGPGARSWCQRADRQNKAILELRRDVRDVEWPGYMNIRITQDEVSTLAPNWEAKLSAANGIYLLVCPLRGEQYVGAAFGPGGFLSRWRQYAANGHGGNRRLIERRKETNAPLQISILEVFGSTMTENDAYDAEARWKRALGSRAYGLNAN